MKESRIYGFVVIGITYILAIIIGMIAFNLLTDFNVYIRLLFADVIATVFVWLVGILFKNASVYDPYWSVQPLVILWGLTFLYGSFDFSVGLLLLAVTFWGVRLTINWGRTFKNLNIQDWRYDNFKRRYPHLFPVISLLGIHLFPTVIVYLVILPGIAMIVSSGQGSVNLVTLLGFAISLLATGIQSMSDHQMHQFRREREDGNELIRKGLWKNARHPNYLGEILMWWGVYIMMVSLLPRDWMLGVGALANTLMFLIVSIPMADRRNKEKPGFDQYMKETRSLIPIKKYKGREIEEEK